MSVTLGNIQKVLELAQTRRDDAATRLAHATGELHAAQAQLTQLSDYAAEGQEKWINRAANGVSGDLVQHQRAFSDKIQYALDYQANVIRQKESLVARAQGNLQAAEQHLAVLRKVEERTKAELAVRAQRRDQKQMDEMAMAMLAHKYRQAREEASHD